MTVKKKTRRRKRTTNNYFTKVHENAIIEYASTSDNVIRTQLYVQFIELHFVKWWTRLSTLTNLIIFQILII